MRELAGNPTVIVQRANESAYKMSFSVISVVSVPCYGSLSRTRLAPGLFAHLVLAQEPHVHCVSSDFYLQAANYFVAIFITSGIRTINKRS